MVGGYDVNFLNITLNWLNSEVAVVVVGVAVCRQLFSQQNPLQHRWRESQLQTIFTTSELKRAVIINFKEQGGRKIGSFNSLRENI